jgi:hypothetical protein
MINRPVSLLVSTMLAIVVGSPSLAADDPIGKDLKATIALQGHPCDEIVSTQRNADSDYTARCKDGNRYHVFVNAQGRVIVEKL